MHVFLRVGMHNRRVPSMSTEDLQHWRDWQSNSGIEQQQMIRLVLQDTDITIHQAEQIAIVGPKHR